MLEPGKDRHGNAGEHRSENGVRGSERRNQCPESTAGQQVQVENTQQKRDFANTRIVSLIKNFHCKFSAWDQDEASTWAVLNPQPEETGEQAESREPRPFLMAPVAAFHLDQARWLMFTFSRCPLAF